MNRVNKGRVSKPRLAKKAPMRYYWLAGSFTSLMTSWTPEDSVTETLCTCNAFFPSNDLPTKAEFEKVLRTLARDDIGDETKHRCVGVNAVEVTKKDYDKLNRQHQKRCHKIGGASTVLTLK